MPRLKLLNDIIALIPDPPDETYGCIIIPEHLRMRLWQGTVVACGPGVRPGYKVDRPHYEDGKQYVLRFCNWDGHKRVSLDVHVGDHVLIGRQQAEEIKEIQAPCLREMDWFSAGQSVLFTRQEEVLGVIGEGGKVKHLRGDWICKDVWCEGDPT
jgi:co-chaperonin GroES (HSP10)